MGVGSGGAGATFRDFGLEEFLVTRAVEGERNGFVFEGGKDHGVTQLDRMDAFDGRGEQRPAVEDRLDKVGEDAEMLRAGAAGEKGDVVVGRAVEEFLRGAGKLGRGNVVAGVGEPVVFDDDAATSSRFVPGASPVEVMKTPVAPFLYCR